MNTNMRLLFLVIGVLSVEFLCGTSGNDKVQELCQVVDNGNREKAYSLVVQLIEQGIDVNKSLDCSERTLLHITAQQAMPRLVSLLLQNGAQVDAEMVMGCHSDKYDGDVERMCKKSLPIHQATVFSHIRDSRSTSEELYKRGAYPAPYIEKSVLTTGERKLVRVCDTSMTYGKKHAIARVRVVHEWLGDRLSELDSDKKRNAEELIRSFEISSKQEGEQFYWDVVAEHEQNKKLIREDQG